MTIISGEYDYTIRLPCRSVCRRLLARLNVGSLYKKDTDDR